MLAVQPDLTLWAWGLNDLGQLGIGTLEEKALPSRIGTGHGWLSVAARQFHSLALKADGTLWAWGDNSYGQLGDGTQVQKLSPVKVGTDNTWSVIAAGSTHSLALKTDGSLWAWGDNLHGQLGDGTTAPRSTPVPVDASSTWIAVAAGDFGTAAVKSDGTLWAWGQDCSGTDHNAPARIGQDTDWVNVSSGALSFAALKSSGTLWTWGDNSNGQLGNGSTCGPPGQVSTPAITADDGHIHLTQGWNFISLGVQPVNWQIGDVLYAASPNVRIVWGYDNQNKTWKRYKFNTQGSAPNTLDRLEMGKGYWIYADGSANLTVAGSDASPAIQLFPGWNLTGYNRADGLTTDRGLTSIAWDILWTWDNGIWTARKASPGVLPVPDIPAFHRGKAYWIKTGAGTWW